MTKTRESVWQPALTASGRAVGIFDGIYEVEMNGGKFTRDEATFIITGTDGEGHAISILMSPKFHPDNDLGKLAKSFGFEFKQELIENEDGLMISKGNNLNELNDYLDKAEGKKFSFKIKQNPEKKGLWIIDLTSIKEFKDKEKEIEKIA